jgi:hypothetical protein
MIRDMTGWARDKERSCTSQGGAGMGEEHEQLIDGLLGMARHVLGQVRATIEDRIRPCTAKEELAAQVHQLREQGRTLVAIAEAMLLVTGPPRDM